MILSLCANDFGDVAEALDGRVDLARGAYWIEQIYQYCRVRKILCVTSPVPNDHQVTGLRREGAYPGPDRRPLPGASSLHYCFPIEDLVDEFLRLRLESRATARLPRRTRSTTATSTTTTSPPRHDGLGPRPGAPRPPNCWN